MKAEEGGLSSGRFTLEMHISGLIKENESKPGPNWKCNTSAVSEYEMCENEKAQQGNWVYSAE